MSYVEGGDSPRLAETIKKDQLDVFQQTAEELGYDLYILARPGEITSDIEEQSVVPEDRLRIVLINGENNYEAFYNRVNELQREKLETLKKELRNSRFNAGIWGLMGVISFGTAVHEQLTGKQTLIVVAYGLMGALTSSNSISDFQAARKEKKRIKSLTTA